MNASGSIVIAPDSLKGTAMARVAAAAMAEGVRRVTSSPIVCLPLSDGGEGFLDALERPPFERFSTEVTSPLGRTVEAAFLVDGNRAVIECAQAVGLHLGDGDVERATSFGVGELIAHAIDRGAKEIVIGLGGSATVDGGLGLLRALGGSATDDAGKPIELAAHLDRATSLQLPNLDVDLTVACDVRQPLAGCARIFGPQKGASAALVDDLERAFAHFAAIASPTLAAAGGAGAAGGLGFALALLGGRLVEGAPFVLDTLDFDATLKSARLCLTAEGRVDGQSSLGKLPAHVMARAANANVPAACLAGAVEGEPPFLVEPLSRTTRSLEEARKCVAEDLADAAERVARRLLGDV